MEKNPTEEKRVFLAVALSMAVLFGWNLLFIKPQPDQPPQTQAAGTPTSTDGAVQAEPTLEALPPEQFGLPLDKQQEKIVVIESPLYKARLTTRGGALQSFQLKNYRLSTDSAQTVEMVPQSEGIHDYFEKTYVGSNRQDLLLRLPRHLDQMALPLSLRIEKGFPEGMLLDKAIFQLQSPSDQIKLDGTESAKISFSLQLPSGLAIKKILTFHAETYLIDYDLELRNTGTSNLSTSPDLIVTEGFRHKGIPESTSYDHSTPVYSASNKRHYPEPLPERGKQTTNQAINMDWVGIDDLYFLSALIPMQKNGAYLLEKTDPLEFWRVLLRLAPIELKPGESTTIQNKAYYGPKENARMVALGYNLDRSIDYGMFRFLAIPMIGILKWIQYITGSYGLAIIVLTILVKIATYPLTAAQIQSMEKMKAMAPELEKLKVKFKDDKDRERFNQEMLGLYKKHGANPASGCWPILVQMPIFLALYSGLLYSIELRMTPFLYIPDLSVRDPYFISPLLMGLSMYLQMQMSPPPADPSQATMMKLMPVIMTGFFLFAPAGLVVYWLVNNVLSIAQQYWMRHQQAKKA